MHEFVLFLHTNCVHDHGAEQKKILSALDATRERLEVFVARSDKILVV